MVKHFNAFMKTGVKARLAEIVFFVCLFVFIDCMRFTSSPPPPPLFFCFCLFFVCLFVCFVLFCLCLLFVCSMPGRKAETAKEKEQKQNKGKATLTLHFRLPKTWKPHSGQVQIQFRGCVVYRSVFCP